jgi:MFS family permease
LGAWGYLVFQLTQSPAYLGYVGFAAGVPAWLFTLYGGVIADRMSRRTLMLITQTAMMILAFVLAGLVFAGLVQPWQIVTLAFLLGVANAFDGPARLAFVVELVEREDLTNAIALNATMFNLATATGPAMAGLTYALSVDQGGGNGLQTIAAAGGPLTGKACVGMRSPRTEPHARSLVKETDFLCRPIFAWLLDRLLRLACRCRPDVLGNDLIRLPPNVQPTVDREWLRIVRYARARILGERAMIRTFRSPPADAASRMAV